jgi:hypothetical protein
MKFIESLFLGIIAALGALVIEVAISILGIDKISFSLNLPWNNINDFSYLIALTAIIEEFVKFIMIVKRIETYSLGRMLVINSLILGAGFGLVEIGLVYFNSPRDPGSFQSMIEIFSLHTLTAGMIGLLLSRLNPKKISTGIKIIVFTSIIHIGYNLLSMLRNDLLNYAIIGLLSLLAIFLLANLALFERKLAH